MKQPEDMTIREERDRMRPLLETGTTCSCCGQRVQMYSRPLTSSMCFALIILFKETERLEHNGGENVYVHMENHLNARPDVPASIRGDFPKLRFWSLIEPMDVGKDDGNPSNGYYKITELGKRFVILKERVPPIVRLYNNKSYGFKKDMKPISIVDALKKKFNYREIMGLPEAALIPEI